VPGNHDPQTSYFLAKVLEAWFKNAKDVEINTEPKPRKYFLYGVNLIGFAHGDDEPLRDLPSLMANECRES
jgi:hypothetical protein